MIGTEVGVLWGVSDALDAGVRIDGSPTEDVFGGGDVSVAACGLIDAAV